MEFLPEILFTSLVASSVYILISVGLTLTFGVLEFINFAHGEMAMLGAFIFFSLYISSGLPLIIAILLTAIIVGLIGVAIEKTTFKPVRDKQEFIPLVLSVGVSLIIQAFAIMIWGAGSKTYQLTSAKPKIYEFLGGKLTITPTELTIIISSAILTAGLYFFLKYSRTGKAIRAVSDNKQVAAIMGINVNKTITLLFAIGSGLAAIGGILIAFDQNLHPRMGLELSIKAFAAIIIGGVGKLHGAIIGALIIGFSENLVVGLTPLKASYKHLVVFILFVIVLLIKPYGIFGGRKEEIESR